MSNWQDPVDDMSYILPLLYRRWDLTWMPSCCSEWAWNVPHGKLKSGPFMHRFNFGRLQLRIWRDPRSANGTWFHVARILQQTGGAMTS